MSGNSDSSSTEGRPKSFKQRFARTALFFGIPFWMLGMIYYWVTAPSNLVMAAILDIPGTLFAVLLMTLAEGWWVKRSRQQSHN